MATINSAKLAAVLGIRGSAKAADQLRKADAERRAKAVNLLRPHEVKGEYSAERLLLTSLGGEVRLITSDDLVVFRKNAKTLGSKLKPGLTAQQIINLSLPEDRERANEQIRMAVPAGTNRGDIRFVTDASADSDVTRHYVSVEIMNFDAAVASPTDPKALAKWLVKDSPLKFECDCGRFTFWYRYIATVGGFVKGRQEAAYPKLRNPRLSGVACKHALRVMKEFSSSLAVRGIVAGMVERGQKGAIKQSAVIAQTKAREIAAAQARKNRAINVKQPSKSAENLKSAVIAAAKRADKAAGMAVIEAQKTLQKLKDAGQISQADFDVITMKLKG
ncbi:hypothetical protein BCF11_0443 [Collimonas sp. PA-H2]|uniref:hypothetical protein n=1 Tax=Collimonas sp. PA-H2 TaxID=1881062 RepID=UPI000BF74658|nr:hypothetical protein [Collimonas sp. PA-H2]PFH08091.1 hypothetical protein BCF11_0443 [Collimonas sp. PA-H2]